MGLSGVSFDSLWSRWAYVVSWLSENINPPPLELRGAWTSLKRDQWRNITVYYILYCLWLLSDHLAFPGLNVFCVGYY